jgi:catechol-2,3-dioxygenase
MSDMLQESLMASNIRPGVVIFTGNHKRLAKFYEAMTGLAVRFTDDQITVLGSDTFELVIHSLPGEPEVSEPPAAREDCYIKPFFPVASLTEARERAAALRGLLRPRNEEWEARDFRACEATDPDGNVIQFREDEP